MKKLLALIIILFSASLITIAQENPPDNPFVDLIANFLQPYFVSLSVLVPIVITISGYVNTAMNAKGFTAQLISWVISIITSFLGHFLSVGIFQDLNVLFTIITGVLIGFVANGIFDTPLAKQILEKIKAYKPKQKLGVPNQ